MTRVLLGLAILSLGLPARADGADISLRSCRPSIASEVSSWSVERRCVLGKVLALQVTALLSQGPLSRFLTPERRARLVVANIPRDHYLIHAGESCPAVVSERSEVVLWAGAPQHFGTEYLHLRAEHWCGNKVVFSWCLNDIEQGYNPETGSSGRLETSANAPCIDIEVEATGGAARVSNARLVGTSGELVQLGERDRAALGAPRPRLETLSPAARCAISLMLARQALELTAGSGWAAFLNADGGAEITARLARGQPLVRTGEECAADQRFTWDKRRLHYTATPRPGGSPEGRPAWELASISNGSFRFILPLGRDETPHESAKGAAARPGRLPFLEVELRYAKALGKIEVWSTLSRPARLFSLPFEGR